MPQLDEVNPKNRSDLAELRELLIEAIIGCIWLGLLLYDAAVLIFRVCIRATGLAYRDAKR